MVVVKLTGSAEKTGTITTLFNVHADIKIYAIHQATKALFDYYRYKIRARVGVDVSEIDTKTHVLGHEVAFPVCLAPVGTCQLVSPLGEIDMATGIRKNCYPNALRSDDACMRQ